MKTLILICAVWSQASLAGMQVNITPEGLDESAEKAMIDLVLDQSHVKERLKGIRYRILSANFNAPENDKGIVSESDKDRFSIDLYDYTNDRRITLNRANYRSMEAKILESIDQLPPSPVEYEDAAEILKNDSYFGSGMKKGMWTTYEAMPGTIDLRKSPKQRLERIIAVGLRPAHSGEKHEIVGVNLSRQSVVRFEEGAPPTALATLDHCGFPSAGQATTARGTSGTASVSIRDDSGETLWTFSVTRPSASGGALGSAIDLKNIRYKGRLVLSRANVPILNVNYDGNACGPYRDWQYSENYFRASGTNIAAGIRRTTTAPTTIFDTGNDFGNFRGVAIHDNGDSIVLTSEISAAWYRYVSEFRFHADGTIEPRFKFSAVENSCVCKTHHHHVYWRFDFDVDGYGYDRVDVSNGTTWSPITRELKQYRNTSNRAWRVVNTTNGLGYSITPGANDRTANAYGKGDVWTLKYRDGQLDDSRVRTSTMANLDAFVTGETVSNTDVVLWYAGHFSHAPGEEETDHIVGPILKPISWPAR